MNTIAVYSNVGGAGKSFIATNLANALFHEGFRVILVDLSFNQLLLTNFGGKVFNSVNTDSLANDNFIRLKLHSAFFLYVVSVKFNGAEEKSNNLLKHVELHGRQALQSVPSHNKGDVIILDIPTHTPLKQFLHFVDWAFEVVTSEPSSCTTSIQRSALEANSELDLKQHIILNKKDIRSALSMDASAMIESYFDRKLISSIHFDSAAPESFAHKTLIRKYAPESQANIDINYLAKMVSTLILVTEGEQQHSA